MTKRPIITEEEIATYERDGFVHLKGVLEPEWVELIGTTIDRMFGEENGTLANVDIVSFAGQLLETTGAKPLSDGDDGAEPKSRTWISSDNHRRVPEIARLCRESSLPAIAAQLFRAKKINLMIDQMFKKEPGSRIRTAFHQDEPYFHAEGEQCASFWIPAERVDAENGVMGYVPGSHRWETCKPNLVISQEPIPGSEGKVLPDIESDESGFGVVYCEAEPGDVIVHHYRTAHGSTGNTSPTRSRRAAAIRYGGDDMRYRFKPAAPPDSTTSAALEDGDELDSVEFPVVWMEP
jgi:hypothetical protein